MKKLRRSTYKGYTVSVRWSEDVSIANLKSRRFTASFSVHNGAPGHTSWQEFDDTVFDSYENASAHALLQAKTSIDVKLTNAGI